MSLAARFGTLALLSLVAGCPTSHGRVTTCESARASVVGTPCEPFGPCGSSTCTRVTSFSCVDGALTREDVDGIFCEIDGGSPDGGPSDAGRADGGMCAPHEPSAGTSCRADAECDASRFERCFAPGESMGCGICVPPMRTCEADTDCVAADGTTGFCEEYVHPCTPPFGGCGGSDPHSTRCISRCTATSCAEGEACGADGRCAPISCVDGFLCPLGTACDPTLGGHGCRRLSCTGDGDCPCGAGCVEGACFDELGHCAPPAA